MVLFSAAIKPSLRIFGSETEGSKNGQLPIPKTSRRKSSTISKPPSNNSSKSAADLRTNGILKDEQYILLKRGAVKGVGSLFAPCWCANECEELINRDKASRDIFCLRDESLEESDNLPDPDVLAQEIVDDLEAALEQFREIAVDLNGTVGSKEDE